MKKLLCIILTVCTLLLLMTSCADRYPLPEESKNFSKEFLETFDENYYMADHDLWYISASAWEAQTPSGLKLAKIDGVEDNMFVSVSSPVSHLVGLQYVEGYMTHIFQHKDAPSPMLDWTIKNIYLLKDYVPNCSWYVSGDEDIYKVKNHINKLYEESIVLHTFSRDTDIEIFNDFKNTYASKTAIPAKSGSSDNYKSLGGYSVVVTFEECENIIWFSRVGFDNSDRNPFVMFSERYHPADLSSEHFSYLYNNLSYETSMVFKKILEEHGESMEDNMFTYERYSTTITEDNIPVILYPTTNKRICISKYNAETGKENITERYHGESCTEPPAEGNFEITVSYEGYIKNSPNAYACVKWKLGDEWLQAYIQVKEFLP